MKLSAPCAVKKKRSEYSSSFRMATCTPLFVFEIKRWPAEPLAEIFAFRKCESQELTSFANNLHRRNLKIDGYRRAFDLKVPPFRPRGRFVKRNLPLARRADRQQAALCGLALAGAEMFLAVGMSMFFERVNQSSNSP